MTIDRSPEERIEQLEERVDNLTEQLEELEDSIEQRVKDVIELYIDKGDGWEAYDAD